MNKTMERAIRTASHKLKKQSPLILSCIASVGVVTTTVLAVKATPRAIRLIRMDSRKNHNGDEYAATKLEMVASAWKCYIPATVVGASTIVCIFGANALNRHQQAALTSAYALVNNSFKEYKNKLKELYGEETHNNIIDSIAKEKAEDIHITADGGWYCSTLDFDEGLEPEVTRTFFDSFSNRYFESTISKVIQAEYHLNRNFMFAGVISLNEFYEFLGLEKTKAGETLGWSSCNGDIYWIDFNHHRTALEDGMEVFVVDMVFEPTPEWLEDL